MNLLTPKPKQVTATCPVAEDFCARFPSRFLVAALTALLIVTVIFAVPPKPRTDSYLAAFIDKQRLLSNSTGEPRIIFVGGSNAAFGIDSQAIQNSLKIRTINSGLHGAIGLRYQLNAVHPHVHRGDIVVVIPEYNQFFSLLDGSTELYQTIWLYPEGARYLSLEHSKTIAQAIPDIIKRKWTVWSAHGVSREGSNEIYNRLAFNSFGDVISHLNKPNDHSRFAPLYKVGNAGTYDQRAIPALNDFAMRCQQRGARLLFSFPPTPVATYKYNMTLGGQSGIQLVEQEVRRNFRGTIIDSPSDNFFDSSLFFNSVNHLAKEGRRLHTDGLIERLRPYVARN